MGLSSVSLLIPRLGELKSSTMITIVDLNISGGARCSPVYSSGSPMPHFSFYWGTEKIAWDLLGACKDDGAPVKC